MRKFIKILFLACGSILIMIPFVLWIKYPELTSMQVFIKYWPYWLIGSIDLIAQNLINKKNE
jgi:hypothetical protein